MSSPQKPIGLSNQPFYIRTPKPWAVDQENYRHDQAMYAIGEPAMFVLMWKVEDHRLGYVRRCPRCYDNSDAKLAQASAAYNQPTQNKCPMCYGTTFEGGVRGRVVRPSIFTDTDDQEVVAERGVKYPQTLSVESTSDFRYRAGDYVFRTDGSRWQLSSPQRIQVRTGFAHPTQQTDSIGYATTIATLEDKTSVAWMIPPSEDDLKQALFPQERYPVFQVDQTQGPLIPKAWTD